VNLAKRLKVEPGSKVKLSDIDPDFHGAHKSEDEAKAELQHNLNRITELQRKLYADRRHCLLIVLQGIDGAGKDGTCWHVVSAMDPQGVSVTGFKQPSAEERDHDFLWRVHPHAPGLGHVLDGGAAIGYLLVCVERHGRVTLRAMTALAILRDQPADAIVVRHRPFGTSRC